MCPNVRHIGILHLVSISTTSPQLTCHSASFREILSKSDHPQQKKMTSYRFLRWRISAILDFRGPIMGSLKKPCTTSYRSSVETIALNCFVFEKIAFLHFGVKIQDGRSPPSWILGVPMMGVPPLTNTLQRRLCWWRFSENPSSHCWAVVSKEKPKNTKRSLNIRHCLHLQRAMPSN